MRNQRRVQKAETFPWGRANVIIERHKSLRELSSMKRIPV